MVACPRGNTPAQTQVTEATGLEKLINEFEALVNEWIEVTMAEGDTEEIEAKLDAVIEQIDELEDEITEELEERLLGITAKLFGF